MGRGTETGYRESSYVEGRRVDLEFLQSRTRIKNHSRHQMFLQDRTAGSIARFRQSNDWKDHEFELPDQLSKVSLANPSAKELAAYVRSFEEAGVDLPVVYPYFPNDERQSFKLQTVSQICHSA